MGAWSDPAPAAPLPGWSSLPPGPPNNGSIRVSNGLVVQRRGGEGACGVAGRALHADAAALDGGAALREELDGARIDAVLLLEGARCERFLGVAFEHRHRRLDDDGPAVGALVDDVHRAPGDADAGRERLPDGVHSRERGQEAGMYI